MKLRVEIRAGYTAQQELMARVDHIKKRVYASETDLRDRGILKFQERDNVFATFTGAPRNAMCVTSPLQELGMALLKSDFFGTSACDLGTGPGGPSAVLSLFFPTVVTWEIDRQIYDMTRSTWQKEGPPFSEVLFLHADFLEKEADLSPFDLVYFYEPFMDDFRFLMREKLMTMRPGAVVLCPPLTSKKTHTWIFQPTEFTPVPIEARLNAYVRNA